MIDADKRKAVFLMHKEGMSAREIAQRLRMGRNTVRRVLTLKGETPSARRSQSSSSASSVASNHHNLGASPESSPPAVSQLLWPSTREG